MNTLRMRTIALALVLAVAPGVAAARSTVTDPERPRELPGETVSVAWTDPAQFSDLRFSGNQWEAAQGDWVAELARYLQKRAERRLPEGRKMEVTITDIMRAGRYEPWRGPYMDRVRVLRDHYPPRMTLNFRITGADGQVLAEGERTLTDLGFMQSVSINHNDLLRYEKRMIDDWLRRELAQPQVAAR